MSAPASARLASLRIGTAGWSLPKQHANAFPPQGSHLERYAARFNAVEINSSFYRPHRRETYERWATSVPADFAFSIKLPRAITHEQRLAGSLDALDVFLEAASGLGRKLAVLLVQLPPSLKFDAAVAGSFFDALRARFKRRIVCEPRHRDWFTPAAEDMLIAHRIARVAADPAMLPAAAEPGGWPGLRYIRLHGVPRVYYSDYDADAIARYAEIARRGRTPTWCIFDNTALGAATANALALQEAMVLRRRTP